MKRALVIVLGLVGFGGCKSEIVDKIEGFADRVCACKDEACALEVQSDYLKWYESNTTVRGSEKDRKRVETALSRYSECHRALVKEPIPAAGAAAPAAPEPATGEPEPAEGAADSQDETKPAQPEPTAEPAGDQGEPAQAPTK